jgi:hypothetical protein
MEYHMRWEGAQETVNWIGPILTGATPSGFSEEDLPSNLIGYYLQKEGTYDWEQIDLYASGDGEVQRTLGGLCGSVMSVTDSNYVRDIYDYPFKTQHYQWDRRPNPIPSPSFIDHYCGNDQSWPNELRIFEQSAIHASGHLGFWTLNYPSLVPDQGWYTLDLGGVGMRRFTPAITIEQINSDARVLGLPSLVAPGPDTQGLYGLVRTGC